MVDEAHELFVAHTQNRLRLVAPFAIYYELPSTLLQAIRRARIDPDGARQALELFLALDLPIVGAELASIGSLNRDAFGAAQRLGCSYYDGIFIALAERLSTQVITADDKVYARLKGSTDLLVWLSEVAVR